MPIGRYFLYIGSLLLALLFVADWYFPALDAGALGSGVDRSVIRIHSSHKWPAAVVIDTTMATIVPPVMAMTTAADELPPARPAREAFALAEATPAVKPTDAVKPAKPHVRRARAARAPAGQIAGYGMFGFRNDTFGSRGMWPAGW
jgi:hypothetical protein